MESMPLMRALQQELAALRPRGTELERTAGNDDDDADERLPVGEFRCMEEFDRDPDMMWVVYLAFEAGGKMSWTRGDGPSWLLTAGGDPGQYKLVEGGYRGFGQTPEIVVHGDGRGHVSHFKKGRLVCYRILHVRVQKAKRAASAKITLAVGLLVAAAGAIAAWSGSTSQPVGEGKAHTVVDFVLDAELTAKTFGVAPAPFYILTAKACFNFVVQQLLILGPSGLCHGRTALADALNRPITFKTTTIAFQALGLGTTAFAYTTLAMSTRPWVSWEAWRTFVYLLTQHSGTVTLLVGLGNNAMAAMCALESPQRGGYSERAAARGLVVVGAAVGAPLWAGVLSAGWFAVVAYMCPCAIAAILFLALIEYKGRRDQRFWLRDYASFADGVRSVLWQLTSWGKPATYRDLSLWAASLVTAHWLLARITRPETWWLALAIVLELLLPLWVYTEGMTRFLRSFSSARVFRACSTHDLTETGLTVALVGILAVVLAVPASLLALAPDVGYRGAAAAAFEHKAGGVFASCTFAMPAQGAAAAADARAGIRAQAHLAQLLSLLT